jgi:uncharacterized protein (DUF1778 family)
MVIDREKRINVRATGEEAEMLAKLADREGVSQSDYIRLFIRRAYAEAFGSPDPKPKRPKR